MSPRTDNGRANDPAQASEHAARAQRDGISWLLSGIAFRAALHPARALALALLLTVFAAWLAITQLEFRTSRLDLLSDSAGYNQRWLDYLARFGHDDDAVVVVSHSDPKRVSEVLTSVGQRLESEPELTGVLYRKSVGAVADKALHLMPAVELEQLDQLLIACSSALGSSRADQVVTAAMPDNSTPNAALSQQLSGALIQAQHGLDRLQQAVPKAGPLLLEDEGKLGLCLVRLPHADDKPRKAQALLACLHTHLNALRSQNDDVDIWLTGMPVLEWDESQSSQRDMQNATLLSLLGVAAIFGFGFGSWRMPCAAVACLAIGLIWTVGLATLCIGHLNLFSVAFGAIIAGLGIDYAIHILTRFQSDNPCASNDELPRALSDAIGKCGKGVFTGSVTTAAAFGVAMLTPFRGMAELGLICALGTLACMVVSIWVLPALLVAQARILPNPTAVSGRRSLVASAHVSTISWLAKANEWILRCRWAVIVCVSALTGLSATQVGQLHYDHNLLNLQADDVPSVHAERELTRRSGQSAWFAISLANSPQQALEMHNRLASLPSVARVEDVGSVIARAWTHPQTSQLVATCRAHAEQLVKQITYAPARPLAAPHTSGTNFVHTASHTTLPDFDPAIASQMQLLAKSVTAMAAPDAPTLSDFPSAVRQRMASQDGQTFLLRIFARDNLWQRENLGKFVKELEGVDPRVTGHPVQTWYASGELENSYYQAGIYAFLAIGALLMIDLGSVRLVLLAILPVALSSLQLCGLLVWMNIPFNAANMIVLPLILGIGVDDGVHIVHDFRARGDERFRLSTSTTLAVLLTSLTTMVGFGSMGIADHRGLQSLGVVLLLGVGLCLLNSWFTLPALLSYCGSQQPKRPSRDTSTTSDRQLQINKAAIAVDAASTTGPIVNPTSAREITDVASRAHLLQHIPIMLSLPHYPDAQI